MSVALQIPLQEGDVQTDVHSERLCPGSAPQRSREAWKALPEPRGMQQRGSESPVEVVLAAEITYSLCFSLCASGRGGRCGREPTRAAGAVPGRAPERPELPVPRGGSAGRGLRGSSRTAAARAAPPPPASLRCSDLRSCCWQGALWREGSCLALISQLLLEVGSWLRRSRRSREVGCSG